MAEHEELALESMLSFVVASSPGGGSLSFLSPSLKGHLIH